MKVSIQYPCERTSVQGVPQQSDGLFRVDPIPGVHNHGAVIVVTTDEDIIRGQPTALEDSDPCAIQGSMHVYQLRSSRRRILPTLDFGNSSRNSMYFGRLNAVKFSRQYAARSPS